MVDISNDQPSLGTEHTGTVKDLAATHQALDTMGAPPGPAQPGPGAGAQGAPISNPPQQGLAPGGPTQPMPQDQGQGRLDMDQVFPPMPQLDEQIPWRESLRNLQHVPGAGTAIQSLVDQIKDQHGPQR